LVALGLVQVGEFAFVMARTGLAGGLIDENLYSLILGVAILTLLLTPGIMGNASRIYFWLRKTSEKHLPLIYRRLFMTYDQRLAVGEELPLSDHVVICGHGRVGSWLGRALGLLEIPYVVVDYNHQLVAALNEKGTKALYGDPADIKVLDYAQVDRAKIVVVAIPDQVTGEMVVANCLTLNPGIKIISRIHHQQDRGRLKSLGVTSVIQPEFEASLSIIHRVLQLLGVSKEDISGKIKRLKIEHGMD
jgi:CPA2 family monovalent cation:H+ antiporter-2